MTKELTEEKITDVITRINAITQCLAHVTDTDTINIMHTMAREYNDRLDYLTGLKEYMVAFKGGGWNTVHGLNDEDSLAKAKSEYDKSEHTQVKRVYLRTDSITDR